MRVANVSGVLTFGGAAVPDSPGVGDRGTVFFRERTTGDLQSMTIGDTGPGAFSGVLFAGTYDVTFETATSSALQGLPSGAKTVLATTVKIAGPSVLAFDVPRPVTVSGAVTLGGAQFPPGPSADARGTVIFRERASGDTKSFPIAAAGPGTFSARVFPGSYDVTFVDLTTAASFSSTSGPVLASNVAITGDRTLALDVRIATISGRLTLGGAALPDSPGRPNRGRIILGDASGAVRYELPIAATGPGVFSGVVYAGTYDVTLYTENDPGLQVLPAGVYTRVATAVAIAGDATPVYDLSVATVSGTMTTSGATSPALDQLRGNLILTDRDGHTQSLPIADTGPAVFSGRVFSGSYEVRYLPSVAVSGLPNSGGVSVASDLAVTGDRTLTFDLPLVTVSGAVTLAGAALPDSPAVSNRGNVVFRQGLTVYTFPVGNKGPAAFSVAVVAGSYVMTFETPNSTALVGLPVNARTSIAEQISLAASKVLPIDLAVVKVSGSVTLGGGQVPDTVGGRGEVVFHDRVTHDLRRFSVGGVGPAAFSGSVFAGSYDVTFEGANAYLAGLPRQGKAELAYGCGPARTCAADSADLTGAWRLVYWDQQLSPLTIDLVQTGGTLRGSVRDFQEGVLTARRSGGDVELLLERASPYCTAFRWTATVADGCSLRGVQTGDCSLSRRFEATR
jgi:hypothetical protein